MAVGRLSSRFAPWKTPWSWKIHRSDLNDFTVLRCIENKMSAEAVNSMLDYPLTYAQESLYFLQQLTNGEPVYNMPQAFRVCGPLDAAALENALRSLTARHEALRLRIRESHQGPRQVAGHPE